MLSKDDITDIARQMEIRLLNNGDPYSGDDQSIMQVCRGWLREHGDDREPITIDWLLVNYDMLPYAEGGAWRWLDEPHLEGYDGQVIRIMPFDSGVDEWFCEIKPGDRDWSDGVGIGSLIGRGSVRRLFECLKINEVFAMNYAEVTEHAKRAQAHLKGKLPRTNSEDWACLQAVNGWLEADPGKLADKQMAAYELSHVQRDEIQRLTDSLRFAMEAADGLRETADTGAAAARTEVSRLIGELTTVSSERDRLNGCITDLQRACAELREELAGSKNTCERLRIDLIAAERQKAAEQWLPSASDQEHFSQ